MGPAVAYAVAYVSKMADENEPIVILWSDHIVKHQVKFKQILVAAEQFIAESPNKIVFIGQNRGSPPKTLGGSSMEMLRIPKMILSFTVSQDSSIVRSQN